MTPEITGSSIADLIIAVAALVAALATIWAKGIKPFAHWFARSWRNVRNAVAIGTRLVEIAEEFRPNGGGSLRDVIDRVETQTSEVQTSLVSHLLYSEARDAEVAAIRAEQTAHAATDAASFAEVKGAQAIVQGAVENLTLIVAKNLEAHREG